MFLKCLLGPASTPLFSVAMLSATFLFPANSTAQTARAVTSIERRIETIDRQAKEFERDNMGRERKLKQDPQIAKRNRQIKVEIEEDLKSLQAAYNTMVTALHGAAEVKGGSLRENFEGVRRSAVRLQANLLLPASSDEEKEPSDAVVVPKDERKAVSLLCRTIYDFVTNPMFESPSAIDVHDGPKIRSDLAAIILISTDLSGRFRPE